jgi:hypothetical protein
MPDLQTVRSSGQPHWGLWHHKTNLDTVFAYAGTAREPLPPMPLGSPQSGSCVSGRQGYLPLMLMIPV